MTLLRRQPKVFWSNVVALCALCGALACGCQGDVNTPDPPGAREISYANDVQPIFNARCTSCHSPGSPTTDFVGIRMVLTAGQSYDSLVDQPSSQRPDLTLVVPGNPDSSLLWLKVSSNAPPVGATMPLLGARLSSAELAVIRDWVDQGAANN